VTVGQGADNIQIGRDPVTVNYFKVCMASEFEKSHTPGVGFVGDQ